MAVLELLFPGGEHLCPRLATLLEKAGYEIPNYGLCKRIYYPEINVKHFRVTVRRPLQIANELAKGEGDAGITGLDCAREFPGSIPLLDLEEPVTKFVLAVPNTPEFEHIQDLQSFIHFICPHGVTIWSEYPSFLRQYLTDHPVYRSKYKEPPGLDLGWHISLSKSPVIVRLSHGATEGNQFFADTTQTCSTIKINGSKVVHTLLERSTPWLTASSQALRNPWKRTKIMEFKLILEAVINNEFKTKTEKV